jgi:dsDNA-specific endonuclease/ATPase MutS2
VGLCFWWLTGFTQRRKGANDAKNNKKSAFFASLREMNPDDPVRIPITDIFDLHTVPARDVKEVVEAYLEEARNAGFKALRIIHGRGIGVQRETVRAVLARTPYVADFRDAPAEAGGWGATIVTLR